MTEWSNDHVVQHEVHREVDTLKCVSDIWYNSITETFFLVQEKDELCYFWWSDKNEEKDDDRDKGDVDSAMSRQAWSVVSAMKQTQLSTLSQGSN